MCRDFACFISYDGFVIRTQNILKLVLSLFNLVMMSNEVNIVTFTQNSNSESYKFVHS